MNKKSVLNRLSTLKVLLMAVGVSQLYKSYVPYLRHILAKIYRSFISELVAYKLICATSNIAEEFDTDEYTVGEYYSQTTRA